MKRACIYFLFVFLLLSCKERYISPYKSPESGYLVVEGVVNSDQGITTIKLSRTQKLENQQQQMIYERRASVKVEGEDNFSRDLVEGVNGQYSTTNLNLNPAVRYRLRIRTSNGKEYLSAFTAVQYTPQIDTVTWSLGSEGVQINLTTDNPLNNTRYYQWEYNETWEITSQNVSMLKFQVYKDRNNRDSLSVTYRDPVNFGIDSSIYRCWQFNASNQLLMSSSAKLEKDFVSVPITFIPNGSEKLRHLYSINIKQYGLSKEAYEFLEKIKKNTEQLGSLFDAQPGELKGNIVCVSNPSEPVIGFVNIGNVTEKRIFISSSQLGGWNFFPVPCDVVTLPNNSDSIIKKMSDLIPTLPSTYVTPPTTPPIIASFEAVRNICVDCTIRGTNVKPNYWP